jgi:hypothetical protein
MPTPYQDMKKFMESFLGRLRSALDDDPAPPAVECVGFESNFRDIMALSAARQALETTEQKIWSAPSRAARHAFEKRAIKQIGEVLDISVRLTREVMPLPDIANQIPAHFLTDATRRELEKTSDVKNLLPVKTQAAY